MAKYFSTMKQVWFLLPKTWHTNTTMQIFMQTLFSNDFGSCVFHPWVASFDVILVLVLMLPMSCWCSGSPPWRWHLVRPAGQGGLEVDRVPKMGHWLPPHPFCLGWVRIFSLQMKSVFPLDWPLPFPARSDVICADHLRHDWLFLLRNGFPFASGVNIWDGPRPPLSLPLGFWCF